LHRLGRFEETYCLETFIGDWRLNH
jgi:hypothetical protein